MSSTVVTHMQLQPRNCTSSVVEYTFSMYNVNSMHFMYSVLISFDEKDIRKRKKGVRITLRGKGSTVGILTAQKASFCNDIVLLIFKAFPQFSIVGYSLIG